MLNNATHFGFVVKDIEVVKSAPGNGIAICMIRVPKDKSGDFDQFKLVFYENNNELLYKRALGSVKKGAKISASGKLGTRKLKDKRTDKYLGIDIFTVVREFYIDKSKEYFLEHSKKEIDRILQEGLNMFVDSMDIHVKELNDLKKYYQNEMNKLYVELLNSYDENEKIQVDYQKRYGEFFDGKRSLSLAGETDSLPVIN